MPFGTSIRHCRHDCYHVGDNRLELVRRQSDWTTIRLSRRKALSHSIKVLLHMVSGSSNSILRQVRFYQHSEGLFHHCHRFLRTIEMLIQQNSKISEGGRFLGAVAHLSIDGQGLFIHLQRPPGLPRRTIRHCHVVEGGRFPATVAHLSTQWQSLLIQFQRSLGLPYRLVYQCHVVEGSRFPSAVAHFSINGQSLLIQFQRSLGLSHRMVHCCHVVEGSRFPGAVAHLSPERQSLLIQLQGALRLSHILIHHCHAGEGGC